MAFRGQPLTAAIIARLQAAGLLVGAGVKPAGGGWQGAAGASTFAPYTVVYAVPGGYFDGILCDPNFAGRPDYIISSFGATQAQAQHGNDVAHGVMRQLGGLSFADRVVQQATCDVEGGVVRDDDVQPPVFHAPSRWRVFETAA